MKIEEIKDNKIWQDFFDKNGSPSFLQSWQWGEFQKDLRYRVKRLGIYKDNDPKAIAQVIQINSKIGNFLFIPHGPVFQSADNNQHSAIKSVITHLLKYLIALAKKEDFSFIRMAPTLELTPEKQKIFSTLGFKTAPIYMHAERLWVLPLYHIGIDRAKMVISGNQPEIRTNPVSDDQLLAQMRKTTRYLIRKAQRDGVIIEKRTDDKAVDDFWKIYQETAQRENFVPFSREFIRGEFNSFNKTNNAIFLFGSLPTTSLTPEVKGGFLAASLIIFTKSTAFYHQGASIHSKIPVTYLLQWEAIKAAKSRGCQFYNFWGIHQPGRTPKSWTGLTLFKTGFAGGQIDYLPTQDYIVNPKYYLTFIYEKFLNRFRGV